MRERLLFYSVKYRGEYASIKRAIESDEMYESIQYDGLYVCIGDRNYPDRFMELNYPPFVVFYAGDLNLLQKSTIGVVGSRTMSDIGKKYCDILFASLNPSYTIVSGLAKGVDAYAHTLALDSHKTIGVIGCGLDIIYPKSSAQLYEEMKRNHLILSEYPYGAKPLAYHFPWRNRLIAALSDKLVVIEAKQRSGTMLSVNEALELNREVYCFPHDFRHKEGKGCNQLISEGASVLIDIEDMKEL